MASLINDLQRNMLPLWRSYQETALAKEMDYYGQVELPVRYDRFNEYKSIWQSKQSIISAADLVNSAVACGNRQNHEVLNAVDYMLQHSDECSPLALDVARSIISSPNIPTNTSSIDLLSFEDQADNLINGLITQEEETKGRIGLLRKQIHTHCNNPIAYCELARCYANLGLDEKATQYMNYAVYLAPQSRYIARCAARFYVHIRDLDRAKKILIENGRVKSDPWVMSAEIAVESLMGRSSRYIQTGRKLVLSGNVSAFSSSELCFAICNEDRGYGKRKDARIMFEKGIIDPNDNSLAQAEFFAKEDTNINLDMSIYSRIIHKNEAETRKALSLGNYQEAFIHSLKWMQDYRFEHRPYEFAFAISCDYLKKYNYAIDIVKDLIKRNPNDSVAVNNLIYALGLSNRIEEAEQELSKIDIRGFQSDSTINSIYLVATCGLIEYRKNNIESGREYYNMAIAAANKQKNKNLAAKARLNMIREEMRTSDDNIEALLNEIEELNTGVKSETEQLKKDILDELRKKEEKLK